MRKDMRASVSTVALNLAKASRERTALEAAFQGLHGSFEKFCLVAGIEAFHDIMDHEASELCGERYQRHAGNAHLVGFRTSLPVSVQVSSYASLGSLSDKGCFRFYVDLCLDSHHTVQLLILGQPFVLEASMQESDVLAYLYYDYVPRLNKQDPFWILRDWDHGDASNALAKASHQSLVKEGVKAIKECVRATLEEGNKTSSVVSLSGGRDSRAVLGGLLETLDSSKIQLVTFGIPGAADFDIARRVAKMAGLKHELFDSRYIPWSTEALVRCAQQRESGLLPAAVGGPYYGYVIRSQFGTEPGYWDGFLGEELSGSELPSSSPAATWQDALTRFIRYNQAMATGGGTPLTPQGYQPEDMLPSTPICDKQMMGFEDQLAFAIRQPYRYFTRANTKGGHQNNMPFRHGSWVNFILNVPMKYRRGGVLYREILRTAYPKLFSLPTTKNWVVRKWTRTRKVMARAQRILPFRLQLPLWGSDVRDDFPNLIRQQPDLKSTIYDNLEDLRQRHIVAWIDVHRLWQEHLDETHDHSPAIRTLVSLEINLKAAEAEGNSYSGASKDSGF